MDCVQERRIKKSIAKGREFGMPMSARKMAEGRCVKTIVWMLPNRLAIEEARSMEPAAMMEVVKKREPRRPSSRLNFDLKNHVTQDLCFMLATVCQFGARNLQRSKARCECIKRK